MMTREEYENAIKSVHGFDFENNLPVYDGDISIYQNFMDIKDEYIQSLEQKVADLEHLLKGARGLKRDAEIYALSLEQKVAELETENERALKALELEKEEHELDRQIHERAIAGWY